MLPTTLRSAPACWWWMQASGILLWWELPSGQLQAGNLWVLFIYFSSQLCCPARFKNFPRPASERVSWCLETSPLLRLPFRDGSLPLTLLSLFYILYCIFYILSYVLSKKMGYFYGCLMSSASIQKSFGGVFSVFKCSLDEFVGDKVVSLSYSFANLRMPPPPKFWYFLIFSPFLFSPYLSGPRPLL